MPEQNIKYLVTAQMTTDLVLVVEAPEGTDEATINTIARELDGGMFTDIGGLSGDWQITGVTEHEADSAHNGLEPYDLTEEIEDRRKTATRTLNDRFRKLQTGGKIVLTQGIQAIGETDAILSRVAEYDDFDEPENDPHREHDSGFFDYEDQSAGTEHKIMWKIDYYDLDMKFHSEDETNPAKTVRALTVMLASEY